MKNLLITMLTTLLTSSAFSTAHAAGVKSALPVLTKEQAAYYVNGFNPQDQYNTVPRMFELWATPLEGSYVLGTKMLGAESTQVAKIIFVRRSVTRVEGEEYPFMSRDYMQVGAWDGVVGSGGFFSNIYFPASVQKDGLKEGMTFQSDQGEDKIEGAVYTYKNGILTKTSRSQIYALVGNRVQFQDDATVQIWISPDLRAISKVSVQVQRTDYGLTGFFDPSVSVVTKASSNSAFVYHKDTSNAESISNSRVSKERMKEIAPYDDSMSSYFTVAP